MLSNTGNPFVSFGTAHLCAVAIIGALALGLPLLSRKAGSTRLTRALALAIAAVILGNEAVYYARNLATRSFLDFAQNRLPLHVCDVAVYLTAWSLCRRGRRAFEVAYYWGLAGTIQGLITPNVLFGFPSYEFIRFFINHGGIVVGVLYATLALRLRPGRGSVLRVFAISNAYMLFVAGVNALIGSNYVFLCGPPPGVSPFFFLHWPWYIVFLEAVALAMFALLYLPFLLADRADNELPEAL